MDGVERGKIDSLVANDQIFDREGNMPHVCTKRWHNECNFTAYFVYKN